MNRVELVPRKRRAWVKGRLLPYVMGRRQYRVTVAQAGIWLRLTGRHDGWFVGWAPLIQKITGQLPIYKGDESDETLNAIDPAKDLDSK